MKRNHPTPGYKERRYQSQNEEGLEEGCDTILVENQNLREENRYLRHAYATEIKNLQAQLQQTNKLLADAYQVIEEKERTIQYQLSQLHQQNIPSAHGHGRYFSNNFPESQQSNLRNFGKFKNECDDVEANDQPVSYPYAASSPEKSSKKQNSPKPQQFPRQYPNLKAHQVRHDLCIDEEDNHNFRYPRNSPQQSKKISPNTVNRPKLGKYFNNSDDDDESIYPEANSQKFGCSRNSPNSPNSGFSPLKKQNKNPVADRKRELEAEFEGKPAMFMRNRRSQSVQKEREIHQIRAYDDQISFGETENLDRMVLDVNGMKRPQMIATLKAFEAEKAQLERVCNRSFGASIGASLLKEKREREMAEDRLYIITKSIGRLNLALEN